MEIMLSVMVEYLEGCFHGMRLNDLDVNYRVK